MVDFLNTFDIEEDWYRDFVVKTLETNDRVLTSLPQYNIVLIMDFMNKMDLLNEDIFLRLSSQFLGQIGKEESKIINLMPFLSVFVCDKSLQVITPNNLLKGCQKLEEEFLWIFAKDGVKPTDLSYISAMNSKVLKRMMPGLFSFLKVEVDKAIEAKEIKQE